MAPQRLKFQISGLKLAVGWARPAVRKPTSTNPDAMSAMRNFCVMLALHWAALNATAQLPSGVLFDNLRRLVPSFSVGHPGILSHLHSEGPKGLAAGDLDGDGLQDIAASNNDGTVSILFGKGAGAFDPVQHLNTGDARATRDVAIADLYGDARPEVIVAHPYAGKLFIFQIAEAKPSRAFANPPAQVNAWPGVRAVAAGDFNGDRLMDLAVGGAGDGFREYRGDGLGGFAPFPRPVGVDAPESLVASETTRPVYAMHVWRKPGEDRDRVVMTHDEAIAVWFLRSLGPNNELAVHHAVTHSPLEKIDDVAAAFLSVE